MRVELLTLPPKLACFPGDPSFTSHPISGECLTSLLPGPYVPGQILPYQSFLVTTCLPDVWNALLCYPQLLSCYTIYQIYHRGLIMLHLKIALKGLRFLPLLLIFQYWGSRRFTVPGGIGGYHQDVKYARSSLAPKVMDAYLTVGVVLRFSGLPDPGFHLIILYHTPEPSGSCYVSSFHSWPTKFYSGFPLLLSSNRPV